MIRKTAADYPSQTFRPKRGDIMYIFSGKWSGLDNFALTPVEVDVGWGPMLYQTSEHAYQAAKADNRLEHHWVRDAQGPGPCKVRGQKVKMWPDWDTEKYHVMWEVLVAKFRQHPHLVELLDKTGKRRIYEGNTWNDRVWGVVEDRPSGKWTGQNALGMMLMDLRDNKEWLK